MAGCRRRITLGDDEGDSDVPVGDDRQRTIGVIVKLTFPLQKLYETDFCRRSQPYNRTHELPYRSGTRPALLPRAARVAYRAATGAAVTSQCDGATRSVSRAGWR
jgi:hypothetical protein